MYYDLYEKEKERYERELKQYIGRETKPATSGGETRPPTAGAAAAADVKVAVKTEAPS